MADFRYRIATTLNHLAHNLRQLQRLEDVEVCVTDWGSPIPLAETLALSPEAAGMCRFFYVRSEVIRATQGGSAAFHTTRAMNVGLRRGRGRFLLFTNADQLFLPHSLEALFNLLEGRTWTAVDIHRTLMVVPRLEVPWQFAARRPGLEEWDRYLQLNGGGFVQAATAEKHYFSGSGGFLMHAELFRKIRGLDERLTGWGWADIDLGLRVSEEYAALWLSAVGVAMYHLGHGPSDRRTTAVRSPNPSIHNPRLAVNDASWGLGAFDLEEQTAARRGARAACASRTDQTGAIPDPGAPSAAGMIEELQGREAVRRVRSVCGRFLRWGWKVDRDELDALFFLSWYATRRYPRSYLEFGVGAGYAAAAVAAACPSVEIYGADRWEGVLPAGTPVQVANALDAVGLRGAIRFLNGDDGTALARLRDSFAGPFGVDLALVRGNRQAKPLPELACDIVPWLAPGGALVVAGRSEDQLQAVWRELRPRHPGHRCVQSSDRSTGLLLTPLPGERGDHATRAEPAEVQFDTGWYFALKRRVLLARAVSFLNGRATAFLQRLTDRLSG